MNSTQVNFGPGSSVEANDRGRQIDSIAWAAFFIWIGMAILAEVPWGWFVLGIGVLVLTSQFGRWQMGLSIEAFWVACGAVFLAGGLWNLLNLPWPLAPILLILLGLGLVAKAIVEARR